MKDIEAGTKTTSASHGGQVERAYVDPRDMDISTRTADSYVFMDKENYEQLSLPADFLEGRAGYLLPNTGVQINFYNGRPIGVDIPLLVVLTVVERARHQERHRHQYFSSRRRWRPGITVQVRPSSTRARRSKVDTNEAPTWRGPEAAVAVGQGFFSGLSRLLFLMRSSRWRAASGRSPRRLEQRRLPRRVHCITAPCRSLRRARHASLRDPGRSASRRPRQVVAEDEALEAEAAASTSAANTSSSPRARDRLGCKSHARA